MSQINNATASPPAVLTLTLDSCCIIDVLENRPSRPHVEALIEAHRQGRAKVYVVSGSASELLRDRTTRENYGEFLDVLRAAGMDDLPQLLTPAYLDYSYLDHCAFGSDEMLYMTEQIRSILFGPNQATSAANPLKWRNQTCDVLALWAHSHYKNDMFITRDRNFLKATKKSILAALGAHTILTPSEAAARVDGRRRPDGPPAEEHRCDDR